MNVEPRQTIIRRFGGKGSGWFAPPLGDHAGEEANIKNWIYEPREVEGKLINYYKNPNYTKPTGKIFSVFHDADRKNIEEIIATGLRESKGGGVWANNQKDFHAGISSGFYKSSEITIEFNISRKAGFDREKSGQGIQIYTPEGVIPTNYIKGIFVHGDKLYQNIQQYGGKGSGWFAPPLGDHAGEVENREGSKGKFISAKTLTELNEKAQNFGISKLAFEGYTDAESLKIGNETVDHFHDLLNKFPELQPLVEKQKLSQIWITNDLHLPQSDVFARYYEREFAIDIAGKQYKEHVLRIGKDFSIGDDYYSTLRHEFGHHLQDHALQHDITFWRKIDLKQDASIYFSTKVSKYAGTNPGEAFAESFSAYTSPKYKRGMLPKDVESYMDKILKGK